MNKRHYLLLFLCSFLFYHCYDSPHISEPIKQESDVSPIMSEAKSILSGCDNSVVLTNLKGNEFSGIKSRSLDISTMGTPIWEKAVELQNGDEEVLLVPLQEEQTRYTHTCIVRGNVDSRQIASSFSQLMIKKKNNRTIAHVITYLPERKYLRKNSSLSDSLIYNPTRFNFEGIVLISSLKGTFKHGFFYEKGIPVIKLFKRHEHTDECSHHSHETEVQENLKFNIFFYTKSLQSRSYGTNEETELFCSTCFKSVDECTCYLIEGEYIYCDVCGERSYECVCDLYRCSFCGKYPCVCGETPELCPICLDSPCTCYDDEECIYCGKDPCECSVQYCNVCYREKSNCACCPDCHKYPCECEETTQKKPCNDVDKGKANPLIKMELAPPSKYNIKGATYGLTRMNGTKRHQGIDLAAEVGTPIYAMFSGTVTKVVTAQPNRLNREYPVNYEGDKNDAGNRIYITSIVNGKTIEIAYFHLQAGNPVGKNSQGENLKVNDKVNVGDIVAYVGITGNSNADVPHLHLGVRINGSWINPTEYLNATVNTTSITITTPCDE